ncbi:MAG TPA: multiubiquitin domain-containing protein [Nitrososphaeraceae archaeon]|nr:multiubiquitin domain-containing protein [Nitrososphaeraceae archaeon]
MEISKAQNERLIYVNERGFPVTENSLSGAELLEMAGFAANEYNLYLVYDQYKSKEIKSNENIEIQNGLRFNAVLKPA